MNHFFRRGLAKIRDINETYREPSIEMSRGVQIALVLLRLYLITLLGLSAYKFITMLS